MQNAYLIANTKVTVCGLLGFTIGTSIFSSKTIRVQLDGTQNIQDYERKAVELYVKPRVQRKLFKDHKASTPEEKLMAKLLQAVSHEDPCYR